MSWLRISVSARAGDVAAVSETFESLGAVAVTTRPGAAEPVLEPAPGEQPLAGENLVTGLFQQGVDAGRIRAVLQAQSWSRPDHVPSVAPLVDEDWAHAWRQQARPADFGHGLWVLPAGEPAPAGARAVVRLDPGLAFGTGAHPTTALCLGWLAARDLRGLQVLDFGCGSGILAIAALVLGAERAFAWDHDPQALEATRSNAAANGVAHRLVLTADPPAVPVLVANILANALEALAPRFADLVVTGGELALSGILPGQAAALAERYDAAFRMRAPRQQEDWVLLTGARR